MLSAEEVIHHHEETIAPTQATLDQANISLEEYQRLYQASIDDPEAFWAEQARKELTWIKDFSITKNTSFDKENLDIRWFEDGVLNVSANCIDRHLETRGDKTAIIWEGDEPGNAQHISYRELHEHVCKCANILKEQGIKKGDRVIIYLPMIPEAAYMMLACTRIGAVHSVVFGGFSPEAIKGRIHDCGARFVITADEGLRGGKAIALKKNVDQAISLLEGDAIDKVILIENTNADVPLTQGRDVSYRAAYESASAECAPESMNAEDPLFILYTSGSTGKPKGVLHTTAGYLLYAAMTHRYIFSCQEDDIYWCTADVGWITGHSYILYGPLANGTTTLMFEGVPNYPNVSRFWEVVDTHKVSIFYTAPTAIRALMREGDEPVKRTSRSSLRILGTVGEPINPEAWRWYHEVVGDKRCSIADTWWQTETGGFLIAPFPCMDMKPGSAALPFFGIEPVIVDEKGSILEGEAEGTLCFTSSWPGQMRTVFGDHQRFADTYFSNYPGLFFSGDGARRDKDGYYWITGRVDDVINVSGHRLGTAEIESSLVAHEKVAEAAVVGVPHDIKGQGIYAFVILNSGVEPSDTLRKELIQWVRSDISPIATPDVLQFAPGLPKTRSGKIMRRILRKIATGHTDEFGDVNTLTNPEVIDALVQESTPVND